MTEAEVIDLFMDIWTAEIGYMEKASNAELDNPTANAGRANYTKYARDMDAVGYYNGRKQGTSWCCIGPDWSRYMAYGMELAQKIMNQPTKGCGAGVKWVYRYFDQMRHFYRGIIPQRGDQAILVTYNAQGHVSSWQHTGVVDRVSGGRVYLIEGNTSPGTAVIPNGGMVCRKSYPLGDKRIYGYGRPRWDVVAKEMDKMTEKEINDLVDKRVKEAVDKAVKEAVEEAVKPLDAALEKAILELTPKVYRTLEDVPDYWREEVAALMKAGAIQGDGTGKLHITETAAQVMAVLERMRKDEIYNTVAECPAWSRKAVQWAVDSGVIQGIGGGKLNLNAMKIWTLQLAYNLANPEA